MKLPILYKKDSKGKIQIWEIEVIEKDGKPFVQTSSGKLDGRRTVKGKFIESGKNIGKSNETTPLLALALTPIETGGVTPSEITHTTSLL